MVSKTKSVRPWATMGLLCLAAMGLTNCEEFQPDFQPQAELVTQEFQSEESPTRGQTFEVYKNEGDSTGIVNDDILDPIETKPNTTTDTERTLGHTFEVYKTEEGDSTGIVNDDILDPLKAFPKLQKDERKASTAKSH